MWFDAMHRKESNKILVEYNKKEYDKLLNKRLVLLKYMDQ